MMEVSEKPVVAMDSVGHNAFTLEFTELCAGGVAGFCEHFIMFPFDTVKTRMQGGSSLSMRNTFKQILQHERMSNLYRGCVPIIASAIPAHAMYFAVYESVKRVLGDSSNLAIGISASCAITAHDTVSVPFDVVKQRMQFDGQRNFRSSLQCLRNIIQTTGFSTLFVALPTTLVMNIPHFAAYWVTYEGYMSYLGGERRDTDNEFTKDFLVGGFLAGCSAALVSVPLDTIKTQLQLGHANTFLDAARRTMKRRGPMGFFVGVVPRMCYLAPSGAIMMTAYELTKRFLQQPEAPKQ